jgi:hypothetical protein
MTLTFDTGAKIIDMFEQSYFCRTVKRLLLEKRSEKKERRKLANSGVFILF